MPDRIRRILRVQVFARAFVIASMHRASACAMCKNRGCRQLSTPAPQGGAVQEARPEKKTSRSAQLGES